MSLHQRARDSGICPPSLLSEERLLDEDGFEAAVLKVIGATGPCRVWVAVYIRVSYRRVSDPSAFLRLYFSRFLSATKCRDWK